MTLFHTAVYYYDADKLSLRVYDSASGKAWHFYYGLAEGIWDVPEIEGELVSSFEEGPKKVIDYADDAAQLWFSYNSEAYSEAVDAQFSNNSQ